MAQCKDCIHEKVCLHKANIETDTYAYMGIKYDTEKCKHYTSADVVPKSEVEKYKQLLNEECDACIGGARKKVAREIFEEIEDVINNIGYFDEIDFKALKKKYTKGEHDEQI